MKLEDALRKIKKCLALARDKAADPTVAAAALRQAQALMAEYQVSQDDARLTDVTIERCSVRTKTHPQWESYLARAVAQAFGCDFIWTREGRWLGHRHICETGVVFVGIGAAPQIAGYAWDVLSRQCAKARLAHIRSQPARCKPITLTARGDEFAAGWVVAATVALQKFAGTDADWLLISNFMKATWPNSREVSPSDRTKGRNVSTNDFHRGFVEGRNAQIKHGVGAASQGLLEGASNG